jgi:hypothetical protein
MISNIISSARTQDSDTSEDFDLIRQTVLMIKREGVTLDMLVPTMRLHSILRDRNLKELQIEQLNEKLDLYFFKKKGVLTEEFVDDIIELSEMCHKLDIPIDKFFESVSEKRQEKGRLIDEIADLKKERFHAIRDCAITLNDLEDYKRDRTTIEHYRKFEKLFHLKDNDCEALDKRLQGEISARIQEQYYREVNEDELESLNMKLKDSNKISQPIDPVEYGEMVQQLLHSPLEYEKEITDLFRRYKRLKAKSDQAKSFGILGNSNRIMN